MHCDPIPTILSERPQGFVCPCTGITGEHVITCGYGLVRQYIWGLPVSSTKWAVYEDDLQVMTSGKITRFEFPKNNAVDSSSRVDLSCW